MMVAHRQSTAIQNPVRVPGVLATFTNPLVTTWFRLGSSIFPARLLTH